MISWSILPIFGSPIFLKVTLLEKFMQSFNNVVGLYLADSQRMMELYAFFRDIHTFCTAHHSRTREFYVIQWNTSQGWTICICVTYLGLDQPQGLWLYLVTYACLTKSAHQRDIFQSQKETKKFLLILLELKGRKLLIVFKVAVLSIISAISDSEILSFRLKAQ